MKKCPRCHRNTLHDEEAMNSLSRRGNGIYICNDCGDDEAMIDAGVMIADDIERDFVAAVGK